MIDSNSPRRVGKAIILTVRSSYVVTKSTGRSRSSYRSFNTAAVQSVLTYKELVIDWVRAEILPNAKQFETSSLGNCLVSELFQQFASSRKQLEW